MSFSSEVKKELAHISANDCCLKAELYGIIRYKSELKLSSEGLGIQIQTMHNVVARRILFLFKKVYNVQLSIIASKRQKLDYKNKYILDLAQNVNAILIDLKILNQDNTLNEQINYGILKRECCKGALLRSLFLVQGSVNDPEGDHYHLEITLSDEIDAIYITKVLENVGIIAKIIKRSKGYVLYLKKSEQISDFLKYIGAVNSLFYFEDTRIKKDYNNSVNRVMNCDIANEEKAIKSATKQLENIKFLTDRQGFTTLTQRLTDAIILRTTLPDASLSELSNHSYEIIGRFVSKSGLSHCYKDIEKLCDEIKGKKV